MTKLNNRGNASIEFCFIAVPLFILMFAIIDFGRYAITAQSLRTLANAGARAMMINCYTPKMVSNQSPIDCAGTNPLSDTAKQAAAPFLFGVGSTPTLIVTVGKSDSKAAGGTLTVTASKAFTMLVPIWGSLLNSPSATTSVPFPPS